MIRTQTSTGIRMSDTVLCAGEAGEQRDDREAKYGTGLWDRERARLFLSVLSDQVPVSGNRIR